MNKLFLTAIAALLVSAAVLPAAYAQTTVVTTTTTGTEHHFHPGNFAWRHGLQNPYGIFQSNNVVTVPAVTLAQSVVNNCPTNAPVLLSTGQCLTTQQALYEIQTGQIQVGGSIQAQGQIVVGNPTVLGAQGFTNAFEFFAHHHDHHEAQTTITTTP